MRRLVHNMENILKAFLFQQQLTDLEIVELWSSFKVGFPEGKLSKPQIMEVVRRVFPRSDVLDISSLLKYLHPSISISISLYLDATRTSCCGTCSGCLTRTRARARSTPGTCCWPSPWPCQAQVRWPHCAGAGWVVCRLTCSR